MCHQFLKQLQPPSAAAAAMLALLLAIPFQSLAPSPACSLPSLVCPPPFVQAASPNEILTLISLSANYANILQRGLYENTFLYILFVMLMHNAQQFHTFRTEA